MKININMQPICKQYGYLRLQYLRDIDKIVLLPCCGILPKYLNKQFKYDPEYFLSNFDQILKNYQNLDMSRLDKFFDGTCMMSVHTNKIGPWLCNNYTYNHNINVVENSISRLCNLKCKMCNNHEDYCKRELELSEQVYKLLEKYKFETSSTCVGEPMLQKDAIFHLIQYGNNSRVNILTNGTLITDEDIKFFEKYKDKMHVAMSIDSMFKDEYESIRVGANFDIVYNNLVKLHDLGICQHVNLVIQEKNKNTWHDSYNKLVNMGIETELICDGIINRPVNDVIFDTANTFMMSY